VLYGQPEESRTGMSFTLENRSEIDFGYGTFFDVARYEDGREMWIFMHSRYPTTEYVMIEFVVE